MKSEYKLRPEDKMEKFSDRLDMITSIIDVLVIAIEPEHQQVHSLFLPLDKYFFNLISAVLVS